MKEILINDILMSIMSVMNRKIHCIDMAMILIKPQEESNGISGEKLSELLEQTYNEADLVMMTKKMLSMALSIYGNKHDDLILMGTAFVIYCREHGYSPFTGEKQ
jgi:hypothetical protein